MAHHLFTFLASGTSLEFVRAADPLPEDTVPGVEVSSEASYLPVSFMSEAEADHAVSVIQSLIDSPLGAAFRGGHLEARIFEALTGDRRLLLFSWGAQAAARLAGVRLPSREHPRRIAEDDHGTSLLTLRSPEVKEKIEPDLPRSGQLPRILIVEDNLDTAMMLATMIETWGYRAKIARNGADARKLAGEYHPRVVLLDLGLPDQHGYRLAREMREHADWGQVSFIVVTGWAAPVDQSLSLNAGISYHLVKPVNPEALRSILDRYH